MKSTCKRILTSPVFITAFALAVRMFIVYWAWAHSPVPIKGNPPYGYETGQVARSIAAGNGFSSPLRLVNSGPTAWFVPIYPYLVAGIFKLWGIYSKTSHIVIETLNCAFAALTVIPIYAAAKKTFGEGAAIGASWTWVFLPTAVFFPIFWVWDTTLTAFLFALIFWATLVMRGREDIPSWAGYGALWALGVSINPSVLSLFPFFLAWLVWHLRKQSPRWLKPAATALLLFSLGLLPWTARNYRVFHKVIVLRSNFGLELWLGNNPDVSSDWSPWMHPNDDLAEAGKYTRMGEIAYMAEKQQQAFEFMRSHPADTVHFMFHRFVEHWLGVSDSPVDSWPYEPLYVKALLILNCVFSLSCLIGILLAYRTRNPEVFPYAMVILIFPLVFYLTHASPRYRFPMDPIMLILAAAAISHLVSSLARLRGTDRFHQPTQAGSLPTN